MKRHRQRFDAPLRESQALRLTNLLQKRAVAISSRPLPKRKIFPFLKLPAEIRNIIYEYTLTDPSGINLVGVFKHKRRNVERISAKLQASLAEGSSWSDAHRMNNSIRNNQEEEPAPLVTSLLAVNKQIHQEGVDILYGKNEFIFTDSFALYNFMINLGPSRSKSLRTLRILGWLHGRAMKAYNHSCFAVLVWATNITAFHIDSQIGWYRASKYGADQLYRDAFPWMESVGMAQGKVDAVVDIIKLGEDNFDGRNSYHRYSSQAPKSNDDMYEEFKTALRKSLGAQRQRVIAPTSQVKRVKVIKRVVDDEE